MRPRTNPVQYVESPPDWPSTRRASMAIELPEVKPSLILYSLTEIAIMSKGPHAKT